MNGHYEALIQTSSGLFDEINYLSKYGEHVIVTPDTYLRSVKDHL